MIKNFSPPAKQPPFFSTNIYIYIYGKVGGLLRWVKMSHRQMLSLLSNSGSVTTLHKFGITSPNKLFYSSNSTLSPAATYDNFELHKDRILKANQNKS